MLDRLRNLSGKLKEVRAATQTVRQLVDAGHISPEDLQKGRDRVVDPDKQAALAWLDQSPKHVQRAAERQLGRRLDSESATKLAEANAFRQQILREVTLDDLNIDEDGKVEIKADLDYLKMSPARRDTLRKLAGKSTPFLESARELLVQREEDLRLSTETYPSEVTNLDDFKRRKAGMEKPVEAAPQDMTDIEEVIETDTVQEETPVEKLYKEPVYDNTIDPETQEIVADLIADPTSRERITAWGVNRRYGWQPDETILGWINQQNGPITSYDPNDDGINLNGASSPTYIDRSDLDRDK